MSVKQTIDFSDDKFIYYDVSSNRYAYTLKLDGKDKEFNIVLSNRQLREMIEKLRDEEIIVIGEDGEIQVEV